MSKKYQVMAIVSRNKITNEIIGLESINKMYDKVSVEFYPDLVTKEDVKEWAIGIWGDNWNNKQVQRYFEYIDKNLCFNIQLEAKDIPSLGNQIVKIESRFVEWE